MEGFVVPAPHYKLEETLTEVVLTVLAPLCRPKDISVFLEKKIITFESHPYFLKLKLPCKVSNDTSEENFDESSGVYTLKLKKKSDGEEESDSDSDENPLNGLITQPRAESQTSDSKTVSSEKPSYGFLNMYSGKFGQYYNEFSQVIDLPDPDNTKVAERTHLRQKQEKEKWCEDHYLADFMENEHMKPLFNYTPPWRTAGIGSLNQDEEEILKSIPKCDTLEKGLSNEMVRLATIQMVDILFAYCYNKRTTEGDNTVESAWTINKLSSTLTWLEVFSDLKSVVLSFYRRSLTYPLYRNWELSSLIHKDVIELLKSGPNQITRCFIEIKELFEQSDNRYILNTLYINPLCLFSRGLTQDTLNELSKEIEEIKVKKGQVIDDLVLLEVAAEMVSEEESQRPCDEGRGQVDQIAEKVWSMNINENGVTSSSDSDGSVSSCSLPSDLVAGYFTSNSSD